ncbi:MAG TPA: magnesium-translocating P-type ATPase [Polyangiales bacterium]
MTWIVGIAACATVVAVAARFADLRAVVGLARDLDPSLLALAVLFQLGTYASQGAIWRYVGKRSRSDVSARFAFELSVAELFVDQALPTGGISGTAFAARVLERHGYAKDVVAAGVVARAVAYYAGYALALAVALGLTFTVEPWGAGYLRAATALFLVASLLIVVAMESLTARSLGRRVPRLMRIAALRRVLAFLDDASPRLTKSWPVLARVTLLQATTIALDAATMFALVWALGGTLSPAAVFTSFMLASVFRSLGIAPGGLGSFEAASVFTLSAAGASIPVALSATLVFRTLSFWLPMLPGFLLSRRVLARSKRGAGAPRVADYWALPQASLLQTLGSGARGLSGEEAEARLRALGPNSLTKSGGSSRLSLFAKQFASPLLWLLVFAALTSSLTGEWVDATVVLSVIVVSVGIGYRRERAAAVCIEPLSARVRTQTRVLRDGKEQRLPVDALVPGDVVLLAAGSLVPADCVLLTATDLQVNQAVLTGESFPVAKRVGVLAPDTPLAERSNTVLLGTNVRSGSASCLVVHTAGHTQFGALAHRLVQKAPETEFGRGTRRFGYLLTVAMLCIVIAVFGVHALEHRPAIETLLFAIALAVGLSPELLPVILNVNLARGAESLAARGVLVRRLAALENLGSMDVLCTDKTGTLTEGVVALNGAFDRDGQPSAHVLALGCYNARLSTGFVNPLDEALERAETAPLPARKLAELPFDFTRKRASVVIVEREHALLISKGAVHSLLSVCTKEASGDALDDAARARLNARVDAWSEEGMRVLAVATKTLDVREQYGPHDEEGLCLEGFLVFADRVKEDAASAVARLAQHGVTVKMVTGDAHAVARHVAREVGLRSDRILTGRELQSMPNEALWHSVLETDVFAEVDPSQKERILFALKRSDHVVGFLGDGVNDAPAMHVADVGLSVDQAVDVAREAADLVLLERSLDVIDAGIAIGRKTMANTMKYVLTTTSANLGNMVSMAIASLSLPFLPLLSRQILLNNLLSDIPAVGIASDDVDPEQVERPERWDIRLIARFMTQFGFLSSVFDLLTFALLGALLMVPTEQFRTAWFVESLLTELLVALVVRTRRSIFASRPGTLLLRLTLVLCAVAIATPYVPFAGWMGFVPLPPRLLVLVLAVTVLYVFSAELLKRALYRRAALLR